jgi:hypothetical protein
MCPVCMTTAALTAVGATSGAGVMVLVVKKWRRLRHRLWKASSSEEV